MDRIARQFLRALRGRRSQVAFSRRLGFRSNVCAKWEGGQRMPTASCVLGACRKLGIDVGAAFEAFHPQTAPLLRGLGDAAVASWLDAERGEQPLTEVAGESGLSRYRVMRFLRGQARPRLPQFFALVQALTRRLPELVALLVDIERVPRLSGEYSRLLASRQAVYTLPWSSAVLALLDTEHFRQRHPATPERVAIALGISREVAAECLEVLVRAGVVEPRSGHYEVRAPLVTDTRADPLRAQSVRRHWAHVSHERLERPHPLDLYGYSVFAVSRADYLALRRLQADYYQRVRALIAESRPSEVAGLVSLHLLEWDPVTSDAASRT